MTVTYAITLKSDRAKSNSKSLRTMTECEIVSSATEDRIIHLFTSTLGARLARAENFMPIKTTSFEYNRHSDFLNEG